MILRGDHHLTGLEILYRMVGAMMPVAQFHGAGTGSQSQQLVAEADTEHWNISGKERVDGGNRIVARSRIARSVGQEDTVWIHG